MKIALLAVIPWVVFAHLFVGVYADREWGEHHVFLKHRPTSKFFFRAPRGEADASTRPGTEGYLSVEEEREEDAYIEFVEKHGGRARSIYCGF